MHFNFFLEMLEHAFVSPISILLFRCVHLSSPTFNVRHSTRCLMTANSYLIIVIPSGEALCYGLSDLRRSAFSNCCFVKLKDSITTIRPHDTQFLYFSVFHISLRAIVSFVVMLWMLILIILCWLLIFQWVNLLQTRVIMLLCV